MIKIGLATLLTLTLAAALLLVPAPGSRTGRPEARVGPRPTMTGRIFRCWASTAACPAAIATATASSPALPAPAKPAIGIAGATIPTVAAGHPLRRLPYPVRLEKGEAQFLGARSCHRVSPCPACIRPWIAQPAIPTTRSKGSPRNAIPAIAASTKGHPIMSAPITPTDCRQCHFSRPPGTGGQTGHASFPLAGPTCGRGLRRLPQEQRLCRHAAGLRRAVICRTTTPPRTPTTGWPGTPPIAPPATAAPP